MLVILTTIFLISVLVIFTAIDQYHKGFQTGYYDGYVQGTFDGLMRGFDQGWESCRGFDTYFFETEPVMGGEN